VFLCQEYAAPDGAFSFWWMRFYKYAAPMALGERSLRQFFAVRQMVAVPARQGRIAGVGKQKWPRRRFDVAGAKDHVGLCCQP